MNPIIRVMRRAQVRANAPRIAANPNPYGVRIQTDIPYIDDGDPCHLLDVYSPMDGGDAPLPVIVELHGGGYVTCGKEINAQHGQYLASRGFRVVNINYTLCPEGDISTIMNELVAALDERDRADGTLYCLTLYTYLICHHSLRETCERLYTHRNTVLYRIRKLKEDFDIPVDDPAMHLALLLSSAMMLMEQGRQDVFMPTETAAGKE